MGTPRSNPKIASVLESRRAADDGVAEIQLTFPDRRIPKSTLPAEMAADPLLKPSDIAKQLKVDPKTVTRWAQKGKFGKAPNVIKTPNGHRRIRTSAYEEAVRVATEAAGN